VTEESAATITSTADLKEWRFPEDEFVPASQLVE
jgi:hypothetical protein